MMYGFSSSHFAANVSDVPDALRKQSQDDPGPKKSESPENLFHPADQTHVISPFQSHLPAFISTATRTVSIWRRSAPL
jgi:hypothetical protein